MPKKYRHILVDQENFKKLQQYGMAGESLNSALSIALKKLKKVEAGQKG